MSAQFVHPNPEVVATLCLEKYKTLPKSGKPSASQWTVIAGIVLHNGSSNTSQVVALGLGTKCIGGKKLCPRGLIVNDSHAEILARRGLLRYLYNEIRKTNLSQESGTVILWDKEKHVYRIKPEYSFHFYSSQSPCGDASILEGNITIKRRTITEYEETETPAKRKKLLINENEQFEKDVGEALIPSEIVYTGAKLLGNWNSTNGDCMSQIIGALRIKPGKGDRTLSMSCSDKISKWVFLGVQGALLAKLLENPIYFSTMTFGHGCNLVALKRALYERWNEKGEQFNEGGFQLHKPLVYICNDSVSFECTQSDDRSQPCPNGIVWCCLVPEISRAYEVIVNGKRQGFTKKSLDTPEAAVKISKFQFHHEFIDILKENRDLIDEYELREECLKSLRYYDAKKISKNYQQAWNLLKSNIFRIWTLKPKNLLEFSLIPK